MSATVFYWLISLVLPVMILLVIMNLNKQFFLARFWEKNIIILVFVLLSGLIASFFLHQLGIAFSFNPNKLSFVLFAISAVVSYVLVGRFGLFYIVSVIIQEFCLLANAQLLFQVTPLPVSIALIAPVYSLSHLQSLDKWKTKLFFTLLWGIITVSAFYVVGDMYLNMSIHLILGALLIQKKVLFTNMSKKTQQL